MAQFKVAKSDFKVPALAKAFEEGNLYLLAWTTTPWTLPSNTALTVGKNIEYALVKTYNQYTNEPIHVVLASNLIGKQFTGKFEAVEGDAQWAEYTAEKQKKCHTT